MQSGILADLPAQARYLTFSLKPDADPRPGLRALAALADGHDTVVGVGATLVAELSARVPGLRPFPPLVGAGVELPSTPAALWCWLRGDDQGELFHRGAAIARTASMHSSLERWPFPPMMRSLRNSGRCDESCIARS